MNPLIVMLMLWFVWVSLSTCRSCVLYSDPVRSSAEVTENLSKCSIKESQKPHVERNGGFHATSLPIQVSQSDQGTAFSVDSILALKSKPTFLNELAVGVCRDCCKTQKGCGVHTALQLWGSSSICICRVCRAEANGETPSCCCIPNEEYSVQKWKNRRGRKGSWSPPRSTV